MRKRLVFPIAFLVIGLSFVIFFSWRLDFLNLPLRIALEKATGQHVTFGKVSYRPFNRITVSRLTVGRDFRCDSVTIHFNPVRLFRNLSRPEMSLAKVHIASPWINLSPELRAALANGGYGRGATPPPALGVSWEKGTVVVGDFVLAGAAGRARLGERLSGRLTSRSPHGQLSLSFDALQNGTSLTGKVNAKLKGARANAEMTVTGRRAANGDLEASIDVPAAAWDRFSLGAASGSFVAASGRFSVRLGNTTGFIAVRGSDAAHYTAQAGVALGPLLSGARGDAGLSVTMNDGTLSGTFRTEGFRFRNSALGDCSIAFSRGAGGAYLGKGRWEPANYNFTVEAGGLDAVTISCDDGKKASGTIRGSISPLKLEVSFADWPLESVPPLSSLYGGVRGTAQVQGSFSSGESKVTLLARGWSFAGGKPFSHETHLLGKDGYWFLRARSLANDWNLSGKRLDAGRWDVKARCDGFDLLTLPGELRAHLPVQGMLSGDIAYASDGNGELRAELRDLAYAGTRIGDAKFGVLITPEYASLMSAAVHAGKGTVTAHGRIGTAPAAPTDVSVTFHRFPFRNTVIHGVCGIRGAMKRGNPAAFEGSIESGSLSIGSWKGEKLRGEILLSPEKALLRNFLFAPFARGEVTFDFRARTLLGSIALTRIPFRQITPELDGTFDGAILLSGRIDRPVAKLQYTALDTRYRGVNLSHSGAAVYRDGGLFVERLHVSSGTESIDLGGKVWPEMYVSGNVNSLSFPFLAALAGIDTPARGFLKGTFTVTGPPENPQATIDLAGEHLAYGGRPVSEASARVIATRRLVRIPLFAARFSDSELRLLSESAIDLEKRTFHLVSEWRNIHLGPGDFFGDLSLAGSWNAPAGKPVSFDGTAASESFWLNDLNLKKSSIGFRYSDGVLRFVPRERQSLTVAGELHFRDPSRLTFRDVTVAWEDAHSLSVNGDIGEDHWDFTVSGNDIAAGAVAEIVALPLNVTGNLDATIVGRGSVGHPQLEGSINVSDGMIGDVPYGNCNLQFSVRQDVLTIIRGRLVNNGRYSVIASGYLPFYLTPEGKKRVENNPIDLTINVEEGTLGLLSILGGDITSANGPLNAQMRLTGTASRPVANGYLRVSNGELSLKRYVEKLTHLNIDCLWKDNLLTIQQFNAKIGGGKINVTGSVAFEGLKPESFDLTLATDDDGRGIPLTVPELPIPSPLFKSEDLQFLSNLSYGEPRFSIRLNGPAESPLLSGWVDIENAHFTYPSLAKHGEGESALDDVWPRLRWDLELRAGKRCWYDNELVSVNVQGGVHLRGKGATPSVSGRVEAIRGSIAYLGTEFKIRRAVVEIVKDEVYIEGEAETETFGAGVGENDTIQMFLDKAEIGRIKPRFVSKNDPKLLPEKALARATGIDPEKFSGADRDYLLRQQIIRLFDSTLTTPLARNILRKSGIVDTFRVRYLSQDPITPTDPANPTLPELLYGTRYSLEKHLSDRVLFGYSVTFDQIQNKLDLRHELELSYRWTRNLFLKGIYELESRNPFHQSDRRITVEQQWRFGWPKKNNPPKQK